ncbi:hypothetical protein HHK36_004847 [Tetracentron sinense]|uniref:J domain-containing protein n=1 Tax=Tetracentron sinense TaxID=13715 RepID=A0A835DLX2_TETSI|nr:hypothetical protein HHK36_004847 [Tetracentron sinense]
MEMAPVAEACVLRNTNCSELFQRQNCSSDRSPLADGLQWVCKIGEVFVDVIATVEGLFCPSILFFSSNKFENNATDSWTQLFQGAAGAAVQYLGYTPGLFIVGLFGILLLWMYANFWITGTLFIVGGYLFSLNHARLVVLMASTYAIYCVKVQVGWLGVLLSINLAFLSNDLLNYFLQLCDNVTEKAHFEEHKESESVTEDDLSGDSEYSVPSGEAENLHSFKSSSTPSVTSTFVNIQTESSTSEVVRADASSMDEMKRILSSMDHYEALGLPRHKDIDATFMRREYRKKAMLVHPDKNMGSSLASESFKKLHCAFEVLSDSAKKKDYDEKLRKEESRSVHQKSHVTSQQFSFITFQVEIPRAFVCAESKIFDVSEWALCQGMSCRPNTHRPSFHVNMVGLERTTQRSNSSRFPWDLDAEMMEEEEEEFEMWFQQALASGLFSETSKRRKSWSPFKLPQKKGKKQWRRSP